MKEDNIVQQKSYAFAVKIVLTSRKIQEEKKEFVLSKQLLRSGTAIGALVEEAIGAQSRKDFYAKMTIAYKEGRETKYWLRLIKDTLLSDEAITLDLLHDEEELLRIIGSIQRAVKAHENS